MELIVRTAHGTADASIDMIDHSVTLRDLIAAVTGQAAPTTAEVDGRLVNTADTLAASGVVAGSIVDTVLTSPTGQTTTPIAVLRQLTGPGAGRSFPLLVGSYRVGPGRRQQADELSADTTEAAAFELEVKPPGKHGETRITIRPPATPAASSLLLGHDPVQRSTVWGPGPLVSGGRIFRLEPVDDPTTSTDLGAATTPSDQGFIIHNRPPGIDGHDRTIAGAIDDACSRSARLWHHRQAAGPLIVDVGTVPIAVGAYDADRDGLEPISVDFNDDRVLALAGPRDDRSAHARAILLDLVTRFGPADVDIVIAATPASIGEWDWAKWLPHVRRGASVELLTNALELTSIGDRTLERSTLVVVTADELWNSSTSPLRSYLLNPPKNAAILVLTEDRTTAPANADAVIELDEAAPGRATLLRVTRNSVELELFVPLIDIETAATAARSLAPLVDPDRADPAAEVAPRAILDDIIRLDEASQRWNTLLGAPGQSLELGVGLRNGELVGVDLGVDSGVLINGSSIDEAVDVATVLVLAAAAAWSPTEASVLVIDHRSVRGSQPLEQLPHHVGTFSERDRPTVGQLLERLRVDVAGDRPSELRLLIVVLGLAESDLAAPGLVDELVDLAAESVGVHLVIATAQPAAGVSEAVQATCQVEVAVDRYGGRRRATLSDREKKRRTAFTPYDDSATPTAPITARPFVFGRQPSALERLLERNVQAQIDPYDHPAVHAARKLAQVAATAGLPSPRPLLAIPLPSRVLASRIWSAHHGDGVPLGLFDDPNSDQHLPYWWQPGPGGSRVFFGTQRSGVRSAFDVLLVGIDRFAVDDIEVYVIEPNNRRRELIASLPHVRHAESPDHHAGVNTMLTNIEAAIRARRQGSEFRLRDHRSMLVMLRDLDRLSDVAVSQLGNIMATGSDVGVNVVAIATRPNQVLPMVEVADQVVVGSLSDAEQYEQLGIQASVAVDTNVGRVQVLDGPLVQLAELDAPLDQVLTALLSLIDDDGATAASPGADVRRSATSSTESGSAR